MEKPEAAVSTPVNLMFLPYWVVRFTPVPNVAAPEKVKPSPLMEVAS